jgi:5-methylcytosine-specific restriction protein A
MTQEREAMPIRPPLHQVLGQGTPTDRRREFDNRRGSSRQRGYTTAWQKARAAYLAQHPLCIFCERDGRVTAAVVVDHIQVHDGDYERFWNQANWQPLCKRHHDSTKQRQERALPEGGGGSKSPQSSPRDRCRRKISASAKLDRGVK